MREYWDAAAGDAGGWVPVAASGAYGVEVDAFNVVEFTPVTTTGLRLRLEAAGTESGAGQRRHQGVAGLRGAARRGPRHRGAGRDARDRAGHAGERMAHRHGDGLGDGPGQP